MEGKWLAKDEKITVWMDGKKTKIKRKDYFDESYPIKEFSKKDAAATIEDSDDDEVPAFVRSYSQDENESFFGRNGRFNKFKPIILALISAIVIGSVLGLFMLSMFVDIDKGVTQNGNNIPAVISGKEDIKNDDKTASDSAASAVTIDAIKAFVLQAGKFGERANAEEVAATFNQAGFSAMVWAKDNYYFVFAGITESRETAGQLTSEFSELEIYEKAWSTDSIKLQLTVDEKKWLQSYNNQWRESLKAVSNKESMSKKDWKKVIDTIPEDSDRLSSFTDFLKKEYENIGQADQWQDQHILLSLWYQLKEV